MQPEERRGNPRTNTQHSGPGVAVQGWWQAEEDTGKDPAAPASANGERGRLDLLLLSSQENLHPGAPQPCCSN